MAAAAGAWLARVLDRPVPAVIIVVTLLGATAYGVSHFPRSIVVFMLFQASILLLYFARMPRWLKGFLTAGIVLGSWWSYEVLGWGGYWGWDPVENASLVPWLTSVALVHGMLLQKARGRFRKLNYFLAAVSYVLVLYATFLTRSGVLADFSVHSFVDLGITGWLVGVLVIFLLLGLGALLLRWREIPAQPGDEPFLSRTVFSVMAIAALDFLRRDCLAQRTLVATVMSNFGLDETLSAQQGRVLRTWVGGREVFSGGESA